ncbi:50S ribosomal protein L17 [Pseudarthrobacter sp. MDT3-28]|uniref:50S ribosomal protein L17 n=1 Tax=Pseudarthrobacter raffinosi TaxID=2953651 RepID=UPI00208DF540|nr:50S ribosomal protein L17 [Pseudarthrobacter sp. MDT3-28]MCO4236051.1 50S ribosomal protein L17 [Pseudarthrobacter sp. MDT3-28]
MPTPAKGPRLGGGAAHERLMLANLSAALFEHKRITTTVTKAKRLKPYAERLVTFAKRGDLASRRRVLGLISNKGIVHELFTDIAQAVENRNGGYTRITKIGNRKGDNAPMAVIELVLEPVSAKQAVVAEATQAAKRDADKKEAAAAAPAVAEEAPEAEVGETEAPEAPEAETEAATEEAPAKKAAKAPAAKKKDEDEAK